MKNKTTILAVIAIIAVVGVIAAIALGGKSDDMSMSNDSMSGMNMNSTETSGSGNASDAVAATEVAIKDYAFGPQVIKVKVGQKVTWTNQDSVRHDVMSDEGVDGGPSSELLANGESYSYTFTKAGTYTYHCSPHPYMKATVIVE